VGEDLDDDFSGKGPEDASTLAGRVYVEAHGGRIDGTLDGSVFKEALKLGGMVTRRRASGQGSHARGRCGSVTSARSGVAE
jgi:hypothetical protein